MDAVGATSFYQDSDFKVPGPDPGSAVNLDRDREEIGIYALHQVGHMAKSDMTKNLNENLRPFQIIDRV